MSFEGVNPLIEKHYDFFSRELIEKCSDYSIKSYNNPEISFRTNRTWDPSIVLDSFPVLIFNLSDKDILNQEITTEIYNKLGIKPVSVMFYYWTKFSYIPWHSDGIYKSALTVYLNLEWDLNWGGYFVYKKQNEDEGTVIPPFYNLGILQCGGVMHCTTPVLSPTECRRTMQMFFGN